MTINTRGIKSKIKSLTSALHTMGIHIAGITETHLASNEEVTIPGYKWLGKPRKSREGGGVGFLIRNDMKNLIEEKQKLNETEHEI